MKKNLLFMLTGIVMGLALMYGYCIKMSKEFDVKYDEAISDNKVCKSQYNELKEEYDALMNDYIELSEDAYDVINGNDYDITVMHDGESHTYICENRGSLFNEHFTHIY